MIMGSSNPSLLEELMGFIVSRFTSKVWVSRLTKAWGCVFFVSSCFSFHKAVGLYTKNDVAQVR